MTTAIIHQDAQAITRIVSLTQMGQWTEARLLAETIADPDRRQQVLEPLQDAAPPTAAPGSPLALARSRVLAAQVRYDAAVSHLRVTELAIDTAQRRLDVLLNQPVGETVDVEIEAEISATQRRLSQLVETRRGQLTEVAKHKSPFEYAQGQLINVEQGYWSLHTALRQAQLKYVEHVATLTARMAELTGSPA